MVFIVKQNPDLPGCPIYRGNFLSPDNPGISGFDCIVSPPKWNHVTSHRYTAAVDFGHAAISKKRSDVQHCQLTERNVISWIAKEYYHQINPLTQSNTHILLQKQAVFVKTLIKRIRNARIVSLAAEYVTDEQVDLPLPFKK